MVLSINVTAAKIEWDVLSFFRLAQLSSLEAFGRVKKKKKKKHSGRSKTGMLVALLTVKFLLRWC